MATATTLTFKRAVIVRKLTTRLNEMNKEIADWEKNNKTLEARQNAWEKKARAWLKKNANTAVNEDTPVFVNNNNKGQSIRFNVEVGTKLTDAIGEYPSQDCRPDWDRNQYLSNISPIDELEANIAAFNAAEEDEIKISINNNIFKYLK
jgi:hypothetical protein